MKHINSNTNWAFLALMLILLFSAGKPIEEQQIVINKPAIAKQVFADSYLLESSVISDIKKYTKVGYTVKSCNGASSSGVWILVMEKY